MRACQPGSRLICPYCRGELSEGASRRCSRCAARHHRECYEAHGGCAVYGCRGGRLRLGRPIPEEPTRRGLFARLLTPLWLLTCAALVCGGVMGVSWMLQTPTRRGIFSEVLLSHLR